MGLVAGRTVVVQDSDPVALVRSRLQQNRPNGVDETLALACEILLVTGWKLAHDIRIDLRPVDGESFGKTSEHYSVIKLNRT